jgi:hypothetical protein
MRKLAKLIIMMVAFVFLAACAASRNEYGVPVEQWNKLSKHEQNLIKQSNQPMTFSENG